MSIPQRALILIPVALLTVAFGCRRATNENTNETTTNNNAAANRSTNTVVTPPPSTNLPVNTTPITKPTDEELRRLALSFTERYGSYSNQTDFSNLESLLLFMTASFSRKTEQFIETERAKDRDMSLYYGITTRAATAETQEYDATGGTAVFLVKTVRKEAIGSLENSRSFQEDLVVSLVRERGAWKVDGATWQSRK